MNEVVVGMRIPPRCLAIHDLSCVGRCSLSVILPVMAVCGVQVVPLPTAILSNHLAFDRYAMTDFSKHMKPFMDAWDASGISFDSIFSGFLASKEQMVVVESALNRYASKDTLVLVDPAMADGGKLYSIYDDAMVREMGKLVAQATLTTPNYTEACLLTGKAYREQGITESDLKHMAIELSRKGPRMVVITSVPIRGGKKGNFIYLRETGEQVLLLFEERPVHAVGTGDLFAAALIGGIHAGVDVVTATDIAGRFVAASVGRMVQANLDSRYGVPFEMELPKLMSEVRR